MKKINCKAYYKLPHAIAPQSFSIIDEKVYFFDKINQDEGRVYVLQKGSETPELILEVDDGDCFFGADGYIYILYLNENAETTSLEVYDNEGSIVRNINLPGNAYYLFVDEKSFIYGIFVDDDKTSIRIYDNLGTYIRTLHSRKMPLLTSIYCDDEYIYACGFVENIPLRIEKLNHMSYMTDAYDITLFRRGALISKLEKQGDKIIALISEGSSEYIANIDCTSKKIEKFGIQNLGISEICDISVAGNDFYILSDTKEIIKCDFKEDECLSVSSINSVRKMKRGIRFGYLWLLMYIKDAKKNFINLLFKAGIPVTMIMMFAFLYDSQKRGIAVEYYEILMNFISLSLLLTVSGTIISNIITIQRKRLRLDSLLDIYNNIEGVNLKTRINSVFMGVVVAIGTFSLFYKNGINIFNAFAVPILSGLFCGLILGIAGSKGMEKFKRELNDMVFELLSLDMENSELYESISLQVRKLRRLGIEKYRIKVLSKDNSSKSIIKQISRWSILRRNITGDYGRLKTNREIFEFYLNLKNRDIKYSRVSVIEDFICYISNNINISSVSIEACDEDDTKA